MFDCENEVKHIVRATVQAIGETWQFGYGGGIVVMDGSTVETLDKATSYGFFDGGTRINHAGSEWIFYVLSNRGYAVAFENGYLDEYTAIAAAIESERNAALNATHAKFTYSEYKRIKAITDFYFERSIAFRNPQSARDLATYSKWRERETAAFHIWTAHMLNNNPVSEYGF